MDAAEAAVKASWIGLNRVLSPAEIDQMKSEVRAAGIAALFAHFSANAVISGTAAVGLVSPSGAVTGNVILPPGSII
jgi:hypothetical protein